GDLGSGHRCRVGAEYDGPHREDEESKPMMHGHEKSDLAIVAGKSANNVAPRCGAIRGGVSRSGVDGAKGGDQGEWEPAKQVPGAEPDKRVTGAGSHAATTCRLDPRWEPYAGKPHVRFCAGGVRRNARPYRYEGASSSRCSAARRWRGRSQRVRSSRRRSRASASSTTRSSGTPSGTGCATSATSKATTSPSTMRMA